MKKVQQFEDFEVWKKASSIATTVLTLTNQPPLKSDYSVKDQIRRSAFSISSNIAEGFEYNNNRDFIRFLRYAKGSAGELRSQLYILHNVEMIDSEQYQAIKEELITLSKQLSNLIQYLRKHTYIVLRSLPLKPSKPCNLQLSKLIINNEHTGIR